MSYVLNCFRLSAVGAPVPTGLLSSFLDAAAHCKTAYVALSLRFHDIWRDRMESISEQL
jgi:hypothetical protein